MALADSDFLHLRRGNNSFLLLKSLEYFHLIQVDDNFTEAKWEKVLRIYPCATNTLQSMGLHISAFRRKELRHVVVSGCAQGDSIDLWVGNGEKYQLNQSCTELFLERFFDGIPLTFRLPPVLNGLDSPTIQFISWCLNFAAITGAIMFLVFSAPYKLWSFLCILCFLCSYLLLIVFPDAFIIFDRKIAFPFYTKQRKGNLAYALVIPGFALVLRSLTDFYFQEPVFGKILGVTLAAGIPLLLLFWLLFRRNRRPLRSCLAVLILFLPITWGIITQLNFLLDFNEPESQTAVILDLDHNGYGTTLELSNGSTLDIMIPMYGKPGSELEVTRYRGAFGISFYRID